MTRNELRRQAAQEWETNPVFEHEATEIQKWWATAFRVQTVASILVTKLQRIGKEAGLDESALRGAYGAGDWSGKEPTYTRSLAKATSLLYKLEKANRAVDDALEENENNKSRP